VLDRFRNPYIIHQWLSITLQYTSKISMRVVPLLLAYYQKTKETPQLMARGLAAYLLFMRSDRAEDGSFRGTYQGKDYLIQDDRAEVLHDWWKKYPDNPVYAVLGDKNLWGTDLTLLPGLADAVSEKLKEWLRV
jgi:tagaturonate reductase